MVKDRPAPRTRVVHHYTDGREYHHWELELHGEKVAQGYTKQALMNELEKLFTVSHMPTK